MDILSQFIFEKYPRWKTFFYIIYVTGHLSPAILLLLDLGSKRQHLQYINYFILYLNLVHLQKEITIWNL